MRRAFCTFLVVLSIAAGCLVVGERGGAPQRATETAFAATTSSTLPAGVSHPFEITLREGLAPLGPYLLGVRSRLDAEAAAARSAAIAARPRPPVVVTYHQPPVVSYAGNVSGAMACIRGAESGNYSESSHPGSGSGAYQFTPGTWAEWSVRAGYGTRDAHGRPIPTWAYAYQAPAKVQDDVAAFTLANGGAHNWDPAYGNDSCTVGFP